MQLEAHPVMCMSMCAHSSQPVAQPLTTPALSPSLALASPCPPAASGTLAAGQQSDHLLLVAAFDLWLAALRGTPTACSLAGHQAGPAGAAKPGAGGGDESRRKAAARAVCKKHYLHEMTLEQLQVGGPGWWEV